MEHPINTSLSHYTHYKPLKSQLENLAQFIFALDSNKQKIQLLAQMPATFGNKLSLAQTLAAFQNKFSAAQTFVLLLPISKFAHPSS